MKPYLIITVIVILAFASFELIPTTHAPEKTRQLLNASLQAEPRSDQQMNVQNTGVERAQEKTDPSIKTKNTHHKNTQTLITLLEDLVDQQHDLPKAMSLVKKTQKNQDNEQILELYKAKILSRSLQFDEALDLLATIETDELNILKAAVLIAKGNRDEAGAFLHDIVDKHPSGEMKLKALALLNIYRTFDQHRDADTSYLWTLFAKQLGEFGEYEIALYLSNKATQLRDNYRDAWLIKGYCEMKLKDLESAEKSLLQAYQLDPGNTQTQYLLGHIYFQLEKPALSSQYLLYAKQNDTEHIQDILEKLAENAISTENYALASHYFEEALQHTNNKAPIYSRLVWLYLEKLLQPDKAIEYAEQRIIAFPNDPESHQLMSWVLTKQDKLDEALKYLEKAEQLKGL